jgi:hypothetical protein
MKRLNPDKLHVMAAAGESVEKATIPRRYTLTHSDVSGDLFLVIGREYDRKAIAKLYTRLMRDEVLAELIINSQGSMEFRVYCHVSGGLIIGTAKWRNNIFQAELPLVLEALRYGDRAFFELFPDLDQTPVKIYFQSPSRQYERVENWGVMADYR